LTTNLFLPITLAELPHVQQRVGTTLCGANEFHFVSFHGIGDLAGAARLSIAHEFRGTGPFAFEGLAR
jgi:hypothetical protein